MVCDVVLDITSRNLDKYFTYRIPQELLESLKVGDKITVPLGKGNREVKAYIINIRKRQDSDYENLKDVLFVESNLYERDDLDLELLREVSNKYFLPFSSVLGLMHFKEKKLEEDFSQMVISLIESPENFEYIEGLRKSKKKKFLQELSHGATKEFSEYAALFSTKSVLKELRDLNIIYLESRKPENKQIESNLKALSLEQNRVLTDIKRDMDQGKLKHLLFGKTGSGKTEIYMHLIEDQLKKGGNVLVMFPEINLTDHLFHRFENAFGNAVSKWHSNTTLKEKREILEGFKEGSKRILLGPRSALFAQIKDISMIIVDEEHDSSFYQSTMPIYNGRDVALMKGSIFKIPIVLGSGTPSLTIYEKCLRGEITLHKIDNKFYGNGSIDFSLVDLSEELKRGNFSIISQELQEEILKCVNNKKEVLLFLNRRGYNNFYLCRTCSHVPRCPHCDVSLTFHKKGVLRCHYCSYEEEVTPTCPKCDSEKYRGIGLGTEKMVQVIKNSFPDLKVCRIDRDSISKTKNINDYLLEKNDIYVGTQLLSKGIDFENVSLIGIMLGDGPLNSSDYRSNEWAMNLYTQLIGRGGRRGEDLKVVIQSYKTDHKVYKYLKEDFYEGFIEDELRERKILNYPPYGDLFKIQIVGLNETKVVELGYKLYEEIHKFFLKEKLEDIGEVFKPTENIINKINNFHRFHLIIKVLNDHSAGINKEKYEKINKFLQEVSYDLSANGSNNAKAYIERNPINMM